MVIKQIRYYDEGYENGVSRKQLNQPSDISAEKLISGEYFEPIRCKEIQIRTYPGTKLTINTQSVYIGETGVYNILYRENTLITTLQVDADSIEYIKNNPKEYFIVTFILDETYSSGKSENSDLDPDSSDQEESGENEGSSSSDYIRRMIERDNHDK